MKKKFITVVTIVSLIALLGVGCTTNRDDAARNNTTRNNSYGEGMYNVDDSSTNGRQRGFVNQYDTNTNYDGLGNSNGIDNMVRNNGASNYNYRTNNNGNTNNNGTNNNYRNSALGDSALTNRIEEICNRKDEVQDSTVVINDDTCYVGLDLDNNQLSEKTKEALSNEIKREDPSITRVYFTEDRDRIEEFINGTGDTLNADWNKLENIFR
ncbi:sporulation lipoprotein YhcN/YlaJ [Alkalibaculum bacchi]|uniref:Sporulation lipoprotein YhcN/YlaJ n=1 Tax=Alkalibaculum bacchi TaxID=645887 RepID=A0A366I544_9FIRM|nr:YhcN/YlaJ family sporulation lipoprotein [Alkalibaculum bacchi]RBP62035.1 sporulation lipoprotein YhcN/YlaJ [Alkalibaculum bacchi]